MALELKMPALSPTMGADWDGPPGGYKQSGIGRKNERDGLEL